MLIIEYRKQKSFMLKIVAAMLFLLLSCGFIFGKEIKGRINAVNYDVSLYVNSNNSLSSVGARLSMIKAGIESAPDGLSWQSLEERGKKIIALSESDNLYKGATLFLNVHMHNEVIEALSTRGILGIIFLAFFYFTLIYYSIRTKKYLLLVFPLSIILFGLSDVITHAKPIPASWIIALFLSILLLSDKREKSI